MSVTGTSVPGDSSCDKTYATFFRVLRGHLGRVARSSSRCRDLFAAYPCFNGPRESDGCSDCSPLLSLRFVQRQVEPVPDQRDSSVANGGLCRTNPCSGIC